LADTFNITQEGHFVSYFLSDFKKAVVIYVVILDKRNICSIIERL